MSQSGPDASSRAESELTASEARYRALVEALAVERARRLLILGEGLNEATGVEEVADVIFHDGMSAVGADACSLALVVEDANGTPEFEVVRITGFAQDLVERYRRFPIEAGRPLSDAVLTEEPVLVQNLAESPYASLTDIGYDAFAAVPVVRGGHVLAGISFSFRAPQRFDDAARTFLATLGDQCAQALERARLYEAGRRSGLAAEFLADASRMLAASLDFETTLRSVAESAVPALADWCAVDILEDPAEREWPPRLKRVAVVHQDPARIALALQFQERFPQDWSRTTGLPRVLRDGIPQFVPVITDDMLVAGAISAEHLAALRELQFCSYIVVPLIARGLTLGALTLVMSDSGRYYDQTDLALARDLAGRAAVAVDNARLFRQAEEARQAAEEARRAAEEAQAVAVSANKAKSVFLATMSHEIRTPINAVLGYSELLEMGVSGPLTDAQATQLRRIQASARHLLTLVNEVLDLAKIESGTLHVTAEQARAGDTVEQALALVRPQAAARQVALAEHCAGACDASYLGDEQRVRQILVNLLSNAVKFTDAGGMVSVTCALTDAPPLEAPLEPGVPYVAVRVSDTGIGIAPEHRARIFEAFTQAESHAGNPYTRERSGTGLGLAISQQLARMMGGAISVESEPGRGSTFTLWVPASRDL